MVYKPKRIPSGIPGLDKLIQDGLVEKSINLIVGDPGAGKTIFAVQFLVEGIKNNEPGLYITFEETRERLYQNMSEFGWDLEKAEQKGLFTFLSYTPEQVKKLLVEGGGIIDNVIARMKIKRLAIDSISSFALMYKDELTKREAALTLFELISKWGCTAILTSQTEEKEDHTISAALEFEVDGIILLYHPKAKGIRKRAIEILKMRGTKIPEKTFEFEITDKGVKINPTKIIIF